MILTVAIISFSHLLPDHNHQFNHQFNHNCQVFSSLSYSAAINMLQQAAATEHLLCCDDQSAARLCNELSQSEQDS